MRALWSDRQSCSHNVSPKVKRVRRLSGFPRSNKRCFPNGVFRVVCSEGGQDPQRAPKCLKMMMFSGICRPLNGLPLSQAKELEKHRLEPLRFWRCGPSCLSIAFA